jgi:hypothetical protein
MVAAIVFASLFGLIGVILAAPVLATGKLLFTYVFRKMFDLDPWEGVETWSSERHPSPFHRLNEAGRWLLTLLKRLWAWLKKVWRSAFPRIRSTTMRLAESIRPRSERKSGTTQDVNPGGGINERSDGTEN